MHVRSMPSTGGLASVLPDIASDCGRFSYAMSLKESCSPLLYQESTESNCEGFLVFLVFFR